MNLDPQGQLNRGSWIIGEFVVSSAVGNEREAAERVVAMVRRADTSPRSVGHRPRSVGLGLPSARLEPLKTAVAEAVLNAMEHGNRYRPGSSVRVSVIVSGETLVVRIADQGVGGPRLQGADLHVQEPDLAAKLAGEQPPRGWGLFLIAQMTDDVRILNCEGEHVVELLWHLDEAGGNEGP
jgi:anti-sigma regulatory factor (Ser/Thr protein kinase)